jgi:response regulator RpfG family c-di-GMP phosphodiesterase
MSDSERLRILYVDDEPVNLRLMRDVFALLLHRPDAVQTAATPEEALRLVESEVFDVVISDQRMPGMCGTDLLALVRERAPRSARMIVTGFPDDQAVCEALRSGVAEAIVTKPWKAQELAAIIRSLVSRAGS